MRNILYQFKESCYVSVSVDRCPSRNNCKIYKVPEYIRHVKTKMQANLGQIPHMEVMWNSSLMLWWKNFFTFFLFQYFLILLHAVLYYIHDKMFRNSITWDTCFASYPIVNGQDTFL